MYCGMQENKCKMAPLPRMAHGSCTCTHKGLVHCSLDLVGAVGVDLLEELVERRVSLELLLLLLLADVDHHLVPVAGVVG